jgi:hypothetical protein
MRVPVLTAIVCVLWTSSAAAVPARTASGTFVDDAGGDPVTWSATVQVEGDRVQGSAVIGGVTVSIDGPFAGGATELTVTMPGEGDAVITGELSGETVAGEYRLGDRRGTWTGTVAAGP